MNETATKPIRVELESRDAFWRNAVMIEWTHQFPDRGVVAETTGTYVIEEGWYDDFVRVAGQCFSTVNRAPADPGRRMLFRRFLTGR